MLVTYQMAAYQDPSLLAARSALLNGLNVLWAAQTWTDDSSIRALTAQIINPVAGFVYRFIESKVIKLV